MLFVLAPWFVLVGSLLAIGLGVLRDRRAVDDD